MAVGACPACGGEAFRQIAGETLIREEIRAREEFVHARVGHKATPTELKDLTDFMHGFPAPLAACRHCGTLQRDESDLRSAGHYEEDPNDPDLMTQVYPRYVEAFRNKAAGFREWLPEPGDVLEIGSHLGAFLQVAEEWNARPVALDVGEDTSAFARRQGFRVRREVIEDTRLADASFDAVFIWNCFEQLTDPRTTLCRAWRLLRRFGVLAVRVPNAVFYRSLQPQRRQHGEAAFAEQALAYNNLLGFPYLYGYTAESLTRLVESCGFKYLRGFNSELVTMPFPDLTSRVEREQRSVSEAVARWSTETSAESGTLTGPWIDLLFRKLSDGAWSARRARRGEVRQLPRRRIDLRFLERAA